MEGLGIHLRTLNDVRRSIEVRRVVQGRVEFIMILLLDMRLMVLVE
jgi:hypothetical protein